MSNGKVMIIGLIAGLIKRRFGVILLKFNWMQFHCIKTSKYYPKSYKPFSRGIKVEVDLSNYATKADIKNISHVDISTFALKTNLANSKTEVDELDIDKLAPVPVDLTKWCGKKWCS